MLILPPDIEEALRVWFPAAFTEAGEAAVVAYGGYTDHELAGRSVQIVTTGGGQITVNVFRVRISLDFRAETEAEAIRMGRVGAGLLAELGYTQTVGAVTVTQVTPFSAPYLNPDPRNPGLFRVTYNVELIAKGEVLP